jgi:hypothetical protein
MQTYGQSPRRIVETIPCLIPATVKTHSLLSPYPLSIFIHSRHNSAGTLTWVGVRRVGRLRTAVRRLQVSLS